MGLFRRLAELREEQILSHAAPYLEDGEEVVQWVRATNFEGKRHRGFLFITEARVILHWTRGAGDCGQAQWHEIEAWGVNRGLEGGPVLAVECEDTDIRAKMPVNTREMADEVRSFIKMFAEQAPSPRRTLRPQPHLGEFEPHAEGDVRAKRRSVKSHTMRVLITILGLVLFFGGILIIPLPGPWSFPIIIAGLAVLATEYDWADDLLDWVKRRSKQLAAKVRSRRKPDEPSTDS